MKKLHTHLAAGFVIVCLSFIAQAKLITFDHETKQALKSSTFTASSGWKFDEEKSALISPENDLTVYFMEKPFDKSPGDLALDAWKSIHPDFSYKILQKNNPPAQDAWDQLYSIGFHVPTQESKIVGTNISVYQGTAYILLFEGTLDAFSRRGAQFGIALTSWKPNDFKKEDLSAQEAKSFSKKRATAFEQFVKKAMKALKVPGVAVSIIQNNDIVFCKGFGELKKGTDIQVTPDTLFMIGSITKPLTTLMIAKLVENGCLTWDTPIMQALPSFQLADPTITPNFLMKHTASASTGMPRRDMEIVFAPTHQSGEQSLEQMQTMKPTTGFDETFQYSNHLVASGGFAAANVYIKEGTLLEKYGKAMDELVFQPLKMHDTVVYPHANSKKLMASPHALDFNNKLVAMPQSIDNFVYSVAPAGSVWSTVQDMAHYVLMELNKGRDCDGTVLFNQTELLKRREPGVKVGEDTYYGLGLDHAKEKGLTIISHSGGTMGFSSLMFFIPDKQIGMTILTNAGSAHFFTQTLKQKLLELLFDAQHKSEEEVKFNVELIQNDMKKLHERVSIKPKDTQWIAAFVGTYSNPDLGTVTIKRHGKQFVFVTDRWQSNIGSAQDASGNKLISLVSAPWAQLKLEFQVSTEPKKLLLDAAQIKYEFLPIEQDIDEEEQK